MSLLDSFRKPDWQSRDAGRRAEAVASGADDALRQALPVLAAEDPDAGVRRAALRRLDDPAQWRRAMASDPDAALRASAREAWLAALAQGRCTASAGDLDALPAGELESLAVRGSEASLRGQALARCQRPAFLAERALAEPDAGQRLALVARLASADLLDRLADKARRADKQVARAARERAQTLRLADGDPAAVQARAEALCLELDALMRGGGDASGRDAVLSRAARDWSGLPQSALPERLQARFQGLCEALRAQLAPPPRVADDRAAEADVREAAQAEAAPPQAPPPPAPPSPEELAAHARLQAELAALADARERERQRAREDEAERQRLRQAQAGHLNELAAALADGDLGRAREAEAKLDAGLFDADQRRRRQALEPELRKLRDWEHWANNKVRARLCDDLEALSGSGLHPDALATRIREAQAEWKRLDALEGRAEGAEATGLDRRFRAICARVLKPARGFFEKRDALRREREQEVARFVAQARQELESAPDSARLLQLQADASTRLRALADLPAGLRQRLARQLTAVLDAIRPMLEAHFAATEQARARLVEAARALTGAGANVNRGAEARRLMNDWKALDKGRPGRDQKQWREFRAALDAAFAELDSARSQAQAQRDAAHQQALALVEEAEALAGDGSADIGPAAAQARELQARWQALDCRDRDLVRRLDQALATVRQAARAEERERQRQRLLARLESGPAPTRAGDAEGALATVFEIESLAGIEPPEGDRDARRAWQLERLQRHLRGELGEAAGGLEPLLDRWRAQSAGLDEPRRTALAERVRAAVTALC